MLRTSILSTPRLALTAKDLLSWWKFLGRWDILTFADITFIWRRTWLRSSWWSERLLLRFTGRPTVWRLTLCMQDGLWGI